MLSKSPIKLKRNLIRFFLYSRKKELIKLSTLVNIADYTFYYAILEWAWSRKRLEKKKIQKKIFSKFFSKKRRNQISEAQQNYLKYFWFLRILLTFILQDKKIFMQKMGSSENKCKWNRKIERYQQQTVV